LQDAPGAQTLRIVVLNSKGGCGKTTVATNIASLYAGRGYGTALFDCDAQASSMRWLRLRDSERPSINGVAAYQTAPSNVTRTWLLRVPERTQRVVVDSPAGLRSRELADHVRNVDVILVPVLPSPIDIFATADFIRDLLLIGKVRTPGTRIGIIANRVRTNTLAFQSLQRFLDCMQIPVVAQLRDTQHYIRAAEQGIGVHELDERRAGKDHTPWLDLVDWIEDTRTPRLALVPSPATRAAQSVDHPAWLKHGRGA
jgi:chromosome partitioning protein